MDFNKAPIKFIFEQAYFYFKSLEYFIFLLGLYLSLSFFPSNSVVYTVFGIRLCYFARKTLKFKNNYRQLFLSIKILPIFCNNKIQYGISSGKGFRLPVRIFWVERSVEP